MFDKVEEGIELMQPNAANYEAESFVAQSGGWHHLSMHFLTVVGLELLEIHNATLAILPISSDLFLTAGMIAIVKCQLVDGWRWKWKRAHLTALAVLTWRCASAAALFSSNNRLKTLSGPSSRTCTEDCVLLNSVNELKSRSTWNFFTRSPKSFMIRATGE